MLKKINTVVLSVIVTLAFCGNALSLTPAEGRVLNDLRSSFAGAANASALTSILNDLTTGKGENGSFWQRIKKTPDALQLLDSGKNNLSSVLQSNKFSTSSGRNTFELQDGNLKNAVLGLVNNMGADALKVQFNLESARSSSRSEAPQSARANRGR